MLTATLAVPEQLACYSRYGKGRSTGYVTDGNSRCALPRRPGKAIDRVINPS